MAVIEIVGGVILLVVSVVIFALTLMHPGLRVRKPSGLSMRPQPRDESGAVFVSICCYKRDKREEAAPRWRAGYGS